VGPWFQAGRQLDSSEIHSYLELAPDKGRAYCVYVHVPFCPSRCSYCALYTFAVTRNQRRVLDEYLGLVRKAVMTYPGSYSESSPTTIHFGGGTPLFLGVDRFADLTRTLRRKFCCSSQCEWAMETSTSAMNCETVPVLKDLGFRRIHLGIQTLNNDLRRRIGRRESGEAALEKILFLIQEGFSLSVDLIIGFDDQTESILQFDLERLYQAGIRMFSICALRNLRPDSTNDTVEKRGFILWSLLWDFMQAHGLKPIHLGQFGRSFQDNLYYTHPARSEDCVAIGPYAHGSAKHLVYGNKLLPHYYHAIREGSPPFKFGVLYDPVAEDLLSLERELLAHRVCWSTVEELLLLFRRDFESLWKQWIAKGLLLPEDDGAHFRPSKIGSWYVGNMVLELRALANAVEYEQRVS
jgi:oxygen-independent coproporphyrinogen-3 oxidase